MWVPKNLIILYGKRLGTKLVPSGYLRHMIEINSTFLNLKQYDEGKVALEGVGKSKITSIGTIGIFFPYLY